jgi:two-component system, LytTR family, sensor kinase
MPLIDRLRSSGALQRDRLLPPVAAGLVLWLVGVVRVLVSSAMHDGAPAIAVLATLPPVLYWLAIAPGVLWLASELPLRRGSLVRSIGLHIIAGAAAAALYAELMVWIFSRVWTTPGLSQFGPVADWGVRFQFGLMSYGFILSWGYVHEYFTRLRERDVALARLETELAQAQLRALKAQVQPHFLFNTLHAITVLIRRDRDAAVAMVMRLSDLLRMTLVDADRPEVPLERELRFLHLYLEIEQTRFRDRLEVVWDVAPGLETAAVPPLILQPLVENALKHGVGMRGSGGRVVIGAERSNGTLRLSVRDNGPGLRGGAAPSNGTGIGLASTRSRLEQIYGGSHRFTLDNGPDGGVSAVVEIPFRHD